ncbi:MAG: VWA domain-containing protein [Bacteroidota bacterium]
MQKILFLLILLTSFGAQAQTVFSTQNLDLGELHAGSERFGDILVTNKGKQKSYILRVEKPVDVTYLASSDVLLPDSSFSFRLQVNPAKKGAFSYDVKVYTSDNMDPVNIRISGNVKELTENTMAGMMSCPDFGSEPSRVQTSELTIITVDENTREPLAKSTVTIIRNGTPAGAWITGKKGSFQQESIPGYFYFFASHDGYFPKEAGVYVGPKIREITIPLKIDPSTIVVPNPEPIPDEPEQLTAETAEILIDQQLANQQSDSVIKQTIPELAQLPPNSFESEHFKPVNVVFVLDVSSSMKLGEKMDLMKYSLNQLVDEMRPEDHISLVTYSDGASVLLAPTACTQQEAIKAKVAELKPHGMTAGGKGIKLGYKQALQQLSPDKATMVIIITDGAFNKSSDDYQKTVRKYAKKGITFSVVGVQNRPNDQRAMEEAAEFGNGRYIPINKLSDAQYNLLQEIRIASFRGI